MQTTNRTKDFYPVDTEKFQNSAVRKQTLQLEKGQNVNRHFTKDADGSKAHEKMRNSTSHWENANGNHSGRQTARTGQGRVSPSAARDGRRTATRKTVCCFLKLNMHLSYDPAAALLGIYLRE